MTTANNGPSSPAPAPAPASDDLEPRDRLRARVSDALRNLALAVDGLYQLAPSDPNAATRRRLAAEWDQQAKVLRRRANKVDAAVDAADRAELERRASWYERRAELQEQGLAFPRELSTPLDHLDRIDAFRRLLADLAELLGEIRTEDFAAFALALLNGGGPLDGRPTSGDNDGAKPPAMTGEHLGRFQLEVYALLESAGVVLRASEGTHRVADHSAAGQFSFLPYNLPKTQYPDT